MTRAELRGLLHVVSKKVATVARTKIDREAGEYVKLHPGGKTKRSIEPHVRGEVRNVSFVLGNFAKGSSTMLNGFDFRIRQRKSSGDLELMEMRLLPPSRRSRWGSIHEEVLIFRVPLADPDCIKKAATAIATVVGRKVRPM